MAGDWIPICVDLLTKREVVIIAARTKWSRYEVVGRLVEFWAWVSAESADGRIDGLTLDELASVHSFDRRFLDALLGVGWVTQDEAGLTIPNFERWLSGSAKRRLRARDRQINHRKGMSRSCHTFVTNVSRSQRDKSVTREEKRREENNIRSSPSVTSSLSEESHHVGECVLDYCSETKNCSEIGIADSLPLQLPADIPSEIATLTFPCDGRVGQWRVPSDFYQMLRMSYQTIDVDAEIRKAYAWIAANPDRRKTARGMTRFLTNWMNRAVDRGQKPPPQRAEIEEDIYA